MDGATKFQALVEQSLVGVYIAEGGVFRYVNPCFAQMFGFASAADLIDAVAIGDLIAPEDRARVLEKLQAPPPDEQPEFHIRFTGVQKNGLRFQGEMQGKPGEHDGRPAVIGVLVDVTELCRAEARLARHNFYDALTGLPNRTLFFDRLHQAIAVAQREDNLLALLYLDLDDFRQINEQCGQSVGDQVLVAVAGRFVGALRATDTLARLGGDAFAVIATGLIFGDDVVPVVTKLLSALEAPVVVTGRRFEMSVSIGVALYPHHAGDAEALYRAADAAMYGAKDKHRGGYCFYVGNVDMVESGGAVSPE